MGSSAGVEVGDRVVIAKHRATVRFVGPVAGQDGLWVGVEWDDPSRGKHDGAGPGGARYFTCCSPSPTAGSFVRASKVSPGKALVEAATQRYTNQLAEGCGEAGSQQYLSTSRSRKLLVELVGQEQVTARQSQLELLTSARVVGAGVSHVVRCCAGPCLSARGGGACAHVARELLGPTMHATLCLQGAPGELAAKLPKLQQLCLSDNLLSSWATVSSICQELPQLQLLDVSVNRLALPSALPRACGGLQQLPGLRCLVLNHCGITWQQVRACVDGGSRVQAPSPPPVAALIAECWLAAVQVAVVQSCLPHLEELHLAGNSIHSLHVQWGEQQRQRVEVQDRGYLAGFLNLQVSMDSGARHC